MLYLRLINIQLGEGNGMTVVKKAIHKGTGEVVAVRCIDRKAMPKEDSEDGLRKGVELMRKLNHPGIVRVVDFFEDSDYFYLAMEFLPGGELLDRMIKKVSYSEDEARKTIRSIATAMKVCHDNGVVHRDMSPENLYMASEEEDSSEVKIGYFHFAASVDDTSTTLHTACGRPGYVAPEILRGEPYGKEVDMWSIGVIAFMLLGGYPPFEDENEAKLMGKMRRGEFAFDEEYWKDISEEAKELIRGLMTVDPEKRITVEQLLAHPWVSDLPVLSTNNVSN